MQAVSASRNLPGLLTTAPADRPKQEPLATYEDRISRGSEAADTQLLGRPLASTSVSLREEGLPATIQQPLVNAVAFSPDGSRLVTGDFNGSVRLWDPRTGRELGSISGNLGDVIDFAVVLDGTRIATSSSDGTVRLWDSGNLEPLVTFASDAERGKLGLNQDGTRLVYPADDGTIRVLALDIDDLLALARSRLTRSWTEDECRSYLHLDRCPPTLR